MKVRTRMNRRAVNQISEAALQALSMTVKGSHDSILSDIMTSEVVPKQTGELERSVYIDESQIKKGTVTLVYDSPYARRLYWHPEYNFRTDKNRNARGMWLEPWANGEKTNTFVKRFKDLLKRLSGGFIR